MDVVETQFFLMGTSQERGDYGTLRYRCEYQKVCYLLGFKKLISVRLVSYKVKYNFDVFMIISIFLFGWIFAVWAVKAHF